MAVEKISVEDLTVRFRLSYDKSWTIQDKLLEVTRSVLHGDRPRYFKALDSVGLKVCEGEVLGIIGPNGCGKSTLLRSICGIYAPDAGSVRRNGRISSLLSLGTGFDNKLNGLDNIRLNALMLGMRRREIEKSIPTILEFADLGDHIHKPMKYYSSGMISRVSFAIVLAMKPDILLIDEVLSVGDLQFRQKSEQAMKDLLVQSACQLIVTHNLAFVREHCNRAVYMRAGQIVADGDPEEIVSIYESEFKNT